MSDQHKCDITKFKFQFIENIGTKEKICVGMKYVQIMAKFLVFQDQFNKD
ncbi:MAG: hypothetical protein FHOMOCKG_00020 [Methanophagales virus GBV302]|uniref:Uncharacterized protein n=1 Tax=Methanophagales virus GBV302 TaxID=2999281 RepID=A0A9E9A5T8_9CAUD|nr:MAG: hypothetical protein QIT37_gp020 [Methanophagales virus GBV302]WAE39548.1 MAG: hypothetical protein FHOMOCKG_00020 [Methanophagales virus GBV302]